MGLGLFGGLAVIIAVLGGFFALFAWLTSLVSALALYFAGISFLMILVVLIQKPKGGGLSGAFGGAGGGAAGASQGAFGSKTGDVLTWLTVACFVIFLGLSMIITWQVKAEQAASQAAGATGF